MKFLVIQQKRIGDVLVSSILSNNLKKEFPDAEIDFMCYANCVDVISNNPNINKIIVLEEKTRKNYISLFKFILKIRKEKYDAVIDAYSKLETNLITFFSSAKYKISYKKGYSKIFYNYNMERFENGTPTQLGLAIDNRLLLLKPLIKHPVTELKPKIFLTESEIKQAKSLMYNFKLNKTTPTFMINVLGSEWYKTYPFEQMSNLLDSIVSYTNANLLLNYIPNQKEEVLNIFNTCKPETQKRIYFDLYAKNLRGFLGLLSQCDALIGNEGGAVNMAKALNIPTFYIFSPAVDKETWQIFEDDKNVSVHLKDIYPKLYEEKTEKEIREISSDLYKDYLKVDAFSEKLKTFLNSIKRK